MSIIAKSNGYSNLPKKIVPAGSHVARCYSMIEIGTVETEYLGQEKMLHKVIIDFELPLELAVFKEGDPEKPFVISKEYTLSFVDKANLRKHLESWRGKAFTDEEAANFDITKLCGVPCMLNIVHKSSSDGTKTYANIASVSPIPKGLTCPDQINPTRILAYDSWDQSVFMSLPNWLSEKIEGTPEFKSKFNMETSLGSSISVIDEEDDGLPF